MPITLCNVVDAGRVYCPIQILTRLLFLGCLFVLVIGCRPQQPAPAATSTSAATTIVEITSTLPPPAAPTNILPPPTATEPGPTASSTLVPTEPSTATPQPTETPAPSATPAATATPVPTATPLIVLPEWLTYLNDFRQMGGVAPINELAALTLGSRLHSEYMTLNDDPIAHWQDPGNPLYNPAGDTAARNSNIFATTQTDANFIWSINFWVSAPFHLVPMLAPGLARVGYGDHIDLQGDVNMAAVLDVRSLRNRPADDVTYPLMFPQNGGRTWIVRHSMNEWPDPLESCPGYTRPAGAPIILQLGDGNLTPHVGYHIVLMDGVPIESCIFDETNYYNTNDYAQSEGRKILNEQDAIVIIPRHPLPIDRLYTVQVEANGQVYSWEFTTQRTAGG